MGYIDKDGFVYFKGRLKRIIVSNGCNIYPSELEKALMNHKEVKECCAVGVKDVCRAQRAVMFAVMNTKGFYTFRKRDELLKFMESYVSKQAMPKDIIFLNEIPKTKLGKVAYTELLKKAEEKTAD